MSRLEIEQGGFQGIGIEVRPEHIGDMNFGIGQLPEQEIADAVFPAGADQQIGLLFASCEQFGGDAVLVDAVGVQLSGSSALGQPLSGLHQLPSSAVVGAHVEVNAVVARRAGRGIGNQLLQFLGQGLQIAEKADPHLFGLQGLQFGLQHPFEQGHQEIHFLPRARPVLRGEGVGREGLDAPVAAQPQGGLQRFNAGTMAHHAR